ncbi:hypothetical protein [Cellulomonas sp. S1-8]|uniref:hypothetical protein n=1 Tax=Cellulomonas sp. S1-8 TaxID=2904790 RepID=UPI00224464B8|nr:hypothetical protein [Cellulomonas sp. S1-8]UZN03076.1 hypothetical protein OKX07_18805 [Cellulomonas sp. S1-8]
MTLPLVVVLLVGGCTDRGPRPVPTPDIVWDTGPPSGEIEADPWVRAVRAGELAYAAAANSANYSDSSMTSTWSSYYLGWFGQLARGWLEDGTAQVVLGPQPFAPLAVDVNAGGRSAKVVGCVGPLAVAPESAEEESARWPQAYVYELELGDDDHRRIVGVGSPQEAFTLPSGDEVTDESCGGVTIARALFDPAPRLEDLLALDSDDVLVPEQSPSDAP